MKRTKTTTLDEKLAKATKATLEKLGEHKRDLFVVKTKADFDLYIKECIGTGRIAVDTETDNSLDPSTCRIMGLCLYSPGLNEAYVPVNHRDPSTKERLPWQMTEADCKEELQKVLDAKTFIVMHNGKFDFEVIKCTCGIDVLPNWDTLIAAKLIDETENHSLKMQYKRHCDPGHAEYNIEKLYEGLEYADVDPDIFALYSATDSYMTDRLYLYQKPIFDGNPKLLRLFKQIEMPMVRIAGEMELYGAYPDVAYCRRLKEKYEGILEKIDREVQEKISDLDPVIARWRSSPDANKRPALFPSKKELSTWGSERLEKKYPQVHDYNGERYRLGKKKGESLGNPVKLTSPNQLSILFYDVFHADPVKTKNPLGTGKKEMEQLKAWFGSLLRKFDGKAYDLVDSWTPEQRYEYYDKHYWLMLGSERKDYEDARRRIEDMLSLCDLLLKRRETEKLITTYLDVVPPLASHWPDGKIRFQLNPLGARTGRFTSGGRWKFIKEGKRESLSGMNSQNIPAKNHEIRLIFKAPEGRCFVGGDFSQQEPKITAFVSQDPTMLKVFAEGKDIYASVVQPIFDNAYEENLEFSDAEKKHVNLAGKERRKVGKVIVLATMYGMGPGAVEDMLNGISEKVKDDLRLKYGKDSGWGQDVLDSFFEKYPEVKKAIDVSQAFCTQHGYVEGLWGRRRHLSDIQLPNYNVSFVSKPSISVDEAQRILSSWERMELVEGPDFEKLRKEALACNLVISSNGERINKAKRQCFNAKIQGGAATLTKATMVMIYNDPRLRRMDAHLVFQIHDEVILDCPTEHAEAVKKVLNELMVNSVNTVGITIPMKCDTVVETRWGEDPMTAEIREAYEKIRLKGSDDPVKNLCETFPNFPRESIEKVINDLDAVLAFD